MTQPDLPPDQDAVRRLLAEARHDEPLPPAVAARLDDVLAELTADRRERDAAPVVDLAARRRRSAGTALLVAAAVVVAGVGIGQVVGGGADMGSSTAGAGSDAGGEAFDSTESEADGGADAEAPSAESSRKGSTLAGEAASAVSSATLRRDLRAALRAARTRALAEDQALTCTVPAEAYGAGRTVPVVLDGEPGVAVYRVPQGERRSVEVYLCGGGEPAATTTLRAR